LTLIGSVADEFLASETYCPFETLGAKAS